MYLFFLGGLKNDGSTIKKKIRISNCFLSQQSITALISNLIYAKKDLSSLKYISKLVNDLSNLLNESDFCDVKIRVGEGKDIRTFKAHSTILKARSSYFKIAL